MKSLSQQKQEALYPQTSKLSNNDGRYSIITSEINAIRLVPRGFVGAQVLIVILSRGRIKVPEPFLAHLLLLKALWGLPLRLLSLEVLIVKVARLGVPARDPLLLGVAELVGLVPHCLSRVDILKVQLSRVRVEVCQPVRLDGLVGSVPRGGAVAHALVKHIA